MYIFGIGNVSECNSSYIHLNDEGKQSRIKATPEDLSKILKQAAEDYAFYNRLYTEIHELYERRYSEVKKRYKYITEEDIEALRKAGGDWLGLSWRKDSNNEECTRQYNRVFGLSDICSWALEQREAARKLNAQAKEALQSLGGG